MRCPACGEMLYCDCPACLPKNRGKPLTLSLYPSRGSTDIAYQQCSECGFTARFEWWEELCIDIVYGSGGWDKTETWENGARRGFPGDYH